MPFPDNFFSCDYDMTFKVQNQSRNMPSTGGSWIWTEHNVVIRLSSVKKRGIRLNVVLMLSRYLQSLKNTYPVAEEKKMTGHFYNNKEFWTDKR